MRHCYKLLRLGVLMMLTQSASSAPGDLDADFAIKNNWPFLAMQSEGKIFLIGGSLNQEEFHSNGVVWVNANGTLSKAQNLSIWPGAIQCMAAQDDEAVIIGGEFRKIGNVGREYIARLSKDGSLDKGFAPNLDGPIYNVLLQPDGKLIIAGSFTTVSGSAHKYIARLNANGAVDGTFNPQVDDAINCLALQADGKILIGGKFGAVNGELLYGVARLNDDGTVDHGMKPEVVGYVNCMALQADGKIVVGGYIGSPDGALFREHFFRLDSSGKIDDGFDPQVNGRVVSIALQVDGKILIGGEFTAIAGIERKYLARLNADGVLSKAFDAKISVPSDNWAMFPSVSGTLLQADGKIVVLGSFDKVGESEIRSVARLSNDDATQSLTMQSQGRLQWLRSGASPEAQEVRFDLSKDGGGTWTPLGFGVRINGGWEKTGVSLPAFGLVRARARIPFGGFARTSSGTVESVLSLGRKWWLLRSQK